ncbi:SDR family NAD(P)-dependent oxidoreductase [Nocardioidaceae bacterium]|nr:SDR family NAD(P)-dependent oxidoreductase [Nocardioidaceae bacterium]
MSTSRKLDGLSVVITGGGRGIGAATAERLLRAGCRVALGDKDPTALEDTRTRLAAAHPGRVTAAELDVTDRDSWEGFRSAISTQGVDRVDVLVNNAGIMPLGPALEESDEVTAAIVAVNLFGVVHGVKTFAPSMVEGGAGSIVNVASAVGRLPLAGGATYSASKFAVVGYSEALRAELEPTGVTVSTVLPTIVKTELSVGVPATVGVKPVTAEQVAEVVEHAIVSGAPELWVPRWAQSLGRTSHVLPRAGQRLLARLTRADRALADADASARRAYEERARG